ncbi:MAG: helix-turn-helix transcriptional regulator [Tildeniella torsiva UHER 1998/13D]|jgi:DNA-binding NarL/FixJ family response regulator|nr:helix-turn-helix transcriptional regulator [Tildeniella torsiva UHER 1998/13D]
MEPIDLGVVLASDSPPIFAIKPIVKFFIEDHQFAVVNLEDSIPGSLVCHFEINGKLYGISSATAISSQSCSDIVDLLTEREIQIVSFVAFGLSNKQIAQKLGISEWTVSAHLRRTFMKLGVDTRAAMVYRCNSLINGMGREIHS